MSDKFNVTRLFAGKSSSLDRESRTLVISLAIISK